ncbi:MAG TPA: hypothetical protein VK919_06355, partial [Solirubrobacterales bacterium]|nr:hypothetical protein [Solirubrobacterales bacterium]
AFESLATNLSPADGDALYDIYVRDLRTNTTTLVSRASGAGGAKGNGESENPSISADGRYVAFESESTNLHPADGDAVDDVYVRDLQTNTTTLVSRASGAGGAKGGAFSRDPAISANGRIVAFDSRATNFHPLDGDATTDVYVRNLRADTTRLVSRASGAGGAKADQNALDPTISADGRIVAFHSSATNLHPADVDGIGDVYARDLRTNATLLVSRASGRGGEKGDGVSSAPKISGLGRHVAFESDATNLHPADGDGIGDVYVRDLQRDRTTLASRAPGAGGAKGDGDSNVQAISAAGHRVVFWSNAVNLHPDDTDATADVYLRDLEANATALASRASGPAGPKSDGGSFAGEISAEGRFVLFESDAQNLHPDDTDGNYDVFRREFAPSNRFRLGKPKRNPRRGTARIPADLPGPGRLVLRRSKQLEASTVRPGYAGRVRLRVRPRGAGRASSPRRRRSGRRSR